MQLFSLNRKCRFLPLNADDVAALVRYRDGRNQLRETGYGSSFLSQSGRFITIDSTVSSVEITDSRGRKRKIALN
ncbi:hypothetical protein ACQ86N_15160 [Puia sp. P3]|uniref:hypothetical protein n=1 Tax=Puia sp. P3 TaxID=3423952 RepID=UPI003D675A94